MRTVILALGLIGPAAAGCGGGTTTINTTPLTEEEKQKMKEEAKQVEDAERGPQPAKGGKKR